MNETRTSAPGDLLTMPRFGGIVIFFRLPYQPDPSGLDIAVCGVPFEGGITNRGGARHGPRAVREVTHVHIRPVHPSTNRSPFELVRTADVGDAAIDAIDRAIADRG